MAIAIPTFAAVRPRVTAKLFREPRLLEDVVVEIADEYGSGFVKLCGPAGSGKSTAIAHLTAIFAHDERFLFLDRPSARQLDQCPSDRLVVAAMQSGGERNLELTLQPWGMDELIEYLLSQHHDECGSVVERLGAAARRGWLPLLAVAVLDRMAVDNTLRTPEDALRAHMNSLMTLPAQRSAAAKSAAALLLGSSARLEVAIRQLGKADCAAEVRRFLAHEMVQLPLAAEHLGSMISNGDFSDLACRLPRSLVKCVGRQCAEMANVVAQLTGIMGSRRPKPLQAMAASILLVADPAWRPQPGSRPMHLTGGIFSDAKWAGVSLRKTNLADCDFTGADLVAANFEDAALTRACFNSAALREANFRNARGQDVSFGAVDLWNGDLSQVTFWNADFRGAELIGCKMNDADLRASVFASANLEQANLTKARLLGANFEGANLSRVCFRQADLTEVDLRLAMLDGACFSGAMLGYAQLEGVRALELKFDEAELTGAYFTGSVFPSADFRGASLNGAHLAEIDWENADLRGADLRRSTFHMGSSRSGLVNSRYACEGSKTGFYTDDLEDLSFKRPEEIRKSNLCGADLRGVNAIGVDFYLVDLRGALLHPLLREQARATGAILENFER